MERWHLKVAAAEITGLILAGGEGRRMGGRDKGLELLDGRPLVEHVLARLRPQVGAVLISANRNLERYAAFGYPVVTDHSAEHQGPLAGIAAVAARVDTPWLLLVPCDAPLLPRDLAERLAFGLETGASGATPCSDGRCQFAFSLLHSSVLGSASESLARGERRLGRWLEQVGVRPLPFIAADDAFRNVNSEHERAALEACWRDR